MSGNTSATGGPLLPVAGGPAPLEGQALEDFIQAWIVGISGIDGRVVRPRFQIDVPALPPLATCWCAYSIAERVSPESPVIQHDGAAAGGLGADNFGRPQALTIFTTWYDTGIGHADLYCDIMSDGMLIPQNREYLQLAGFDYGEQMQAVIAPVLVKERWQYRIDKRFILRRIVNRVYPVQNLLRAAGAIESSDGAAEAFMTANPPSA